MSERRRLAVLRPVPQQEDGDFEGNETEALAPPRVIARTRVRLVRELVLVPTLYLGYTLGRSVAARHTGAAMHHAQTIWALERHLRLLNEATVQQWALHSPRLIALANLHYQVAYVISIVGTLAWLYTRHPEHYLWFRRLLTAVTGLGLVLHLVYPMAPPRLLAGDGLIDSATVYGHAVYGPVGTGLANQFAAMPSLHVGWAVIVAVPFIVILRSRWRWLAVLHPIITVAVVVATGNHFWMDGIVATILVALAMLAGRHWRLGWDPRPSST